MFIPIGHDQGELRRWPIVSFAVIIACVAIFFLQPGLSRDDLKRAGEHMSAAVKYYAGNPDLHPSPRVQLALDQWLRLQDSDARAQLQRQMERATRDAASRPTRQAELDRLTGEWLSILARSPSWRWGVIPADFEPLKLLTYMFIHAGFLHLFFNLLFLYMTGPFIEDVWGRPLFTAFYLVAGVFAGAMFIVQNPSLDAPLVGASGAIAGVMGAFLVRYPKAKIKFLNFIVFIRFTFRAPAWLMLSLWFVGELLNARAASYNPIGTAQVAYWAHVWGFAFGVGVGVLLKLLNAEERFLFDAIERRREAARNPFVQQVERLLTQGKQAEACQLLAAEILRNPADAEIAETYWHLARLGPMATQPAVCLRIIQNDLRRGDEYLAIERWREFHAAVPATYPDIPLTIRLARALARHNEAPAGHALIEAAARRIDTSTPPEVQMELTRFALDVGNPVGAELAERIQADPRITPEAKLALKQSLRWKTAVK